ncbi:tyrosine-type recombinase/integrase [Sphingosinicellaceae bacterium]|nr:tyrosine-type recombinase/integrase [Sphingosinicellaceae bacterium]
MFSEEALGLINAIGLRADPASLGFRRLCSLLVTAHTTVAEEIVARDHGHGSVTPTLLPRAASQLTLKPASSSAALMTLFDGYVAERKPSASTVRNWRPYITSLSHFLGHDEASRITAADVRQWTKKLLSEPNTRGNILAASTVNDGYLAAIKTVLGWGEENELITANVATAVRVRVPKRLKLRDRGFTELEAMTILRAALDPPDPKLSVERKLAQRWVPWLCAHTGARVNELSQLRAEDVRQEGDIWCIRITPEAGTVKDGTARVVPLHRQLIEQGFLKMVAAKGEGRLFYDPSRQRKPDVDNRQSKKVGEHIAAWVRRLGVNDPAVSPNHGWRHLFKTTARLVGMDPSARDVIQGHAAKSEGEKYGHYPLSALAAELAKRPSFDVTGPPA